MKLVIPEYKAAKQAGKENAAPACACQDKGGPVMTDSRTLGQSVPKEGLFLMDGIEGLRSLPKHSVDML